MQRRLSRKATVIVCGLLLAFLLACEAEPGGGKQVYEVCETIGNEQVCRKVRMTREECLQRYSKNFCG